MPTKKPRIKPGEDTPMHKRYRSADGEVYVTIAEVAAKTGRHVTTVYNWCRNGHVRHQRFGLGGGKSPSFFIALSSLREFLGPLADTMDL